MAERTINITFDGYWRDNSKGGIPAASGVYCVYECRHNAADKTVNLLKLIYIGEADDVCGRIAKHEKYDDWLSHVSAGNELCFSFGGVDATMRDRAEAALIFKHEPLENTEYVDSFPFDRTTMVLSGETSLLNTHFAVERTE
ncbi:MAG: GIY-YIG nuclease family protein [Verrucomicrobia bacterium]|nr:GIY-YIG nuclease family protein [Verrucomicrobiota bacterium]